MSLPRFCEAVRWQLPEGGELLRFEGRLSLADLGEAARLFPARQPPVDLGAVAGPFPALEPPAGSTGELPWWERRLQLVRGIGPQREARLRARGYATLSALSGHRAYGPPAREVLELIRRREVGALRRRGARDGELVQLFGAGEAAALDVETLGLAPVFPAFLAGLAWQEGDGWAYLQLLVPHPDHEPALLRALDRLVRSRFAALVTYNGRSFDLPYLSMRRRYHGLEDGEPWPAVPCLDLLAEVRRRLKPFVGSARLGQVGAFITCRTREGEVGAEEVPVYYQRFLESGDGALIEPVLAHNYHDLCALVAVWAWLSARGGAEATAGRPAPQAGAAEGAAGWVVPDAVAGPAAAGGGPGWPRG